MFDYMNTIDNRDLYTTKYNCMLCNTGDSGNILKTDINKLSLLIDKHYMNFNCIRLF